MSKEAWFVLLGSSITGFLTFLGIMATQHYSLKESKRKSAEEKPTKSAEAASIIADASGDVVAMLNKELQKQIERSERQDKRISYLESKIERMEEKQTRTEEKQIRTEEKLNDIVERERTIAMEYRVLWDGTHENIKQIVELGEIPTFKPAMQMFRGTVDWSDKGKKTIVDNSDMIKGVEDE